MSNKKFISIEEFFSKTLPDLQNNPDGDKTVVFIGAGLSTNYGCSSWSELAKDVIKKCHEHEVLDYRTSQELLNKESSYKTLLTIGKEFLSKNHKPEIFIECLRKSLNDENISTDKTGIYAYLKNIFNYFITTNADRHIDVFFDSPKVKIANISSPQQLEPETLYKIHGCISEPKSMVFTIEQYLKNYSVSQDVNNYTLGNFLQHIFATYNVIFIGYGLAEFELLERIIGKSNKSHYIINGYFNHQDPLISAYDLYFNLLNVQQVVYRLDEVGYKKLNNWIETYHHSRQSRIYEPIVDFSKIDEALGI